MLVPAAPTTPALASKQDGQVAVAEVLAQATGLLGRGDETPSAPRAPRRVGSPRLRQGNVIVRTSTKVGSAACRAQTHRT